MKTKRLFLSCIEQFKSRKNLTILAILLAIAAVVVPTRTISRAFAAIQKTSTKVGAPGAATPKKAAEPKATAKKAPPVLIPQKGPGPDEVIQGVTTTGAPGITETVEQIMARERANPVRPSNEVTETKQEIEFKPNKLPNPDAPAVSSWPPSATSPITESPFNPQTVSTSIAGPGRNADGIGSVPPDSIGAVGATQILMHANGRIKVYDKTTGAVGGLDAADTTFWNSVRNGVGISDPRVRYDRLSQRWFLVMINVANSLNRVMIAVSSGPTITDSSSFTFFQFAVASGFADYPTLGVDKNALYIGANMFTTSVGSFSSTRGFVINKANLLTGTLTLTTFNNLATAASAGPLTPQGVDNDDPNATEGYFVGVDIIAFSLLQIRRVSDPGGTPTISGNLSLTVPTTVDSINQEHQGRSTVGALRFLDSLGDRLYAAMIRTNKITGVKTLWTAHNIEVNSSGVGASGGGRNGSRWYEIGSLTTTPALVQAGTLFDSAATNPHGYWIPSVAMSGQGHMALGASSAGVNRFAEIWVAGRLRTDTLGTTQAPIQAQASSTAYNLQSATVQRWGDYSLTTVDPLDDQTMWTVQEYCDANNSWRMRAVKLLAPPPPVTATASPASMILGQASVNLVITGTPAANSGQEFFDPGADTGGPGFTRLAASAQTAGIIVNSVTFNSPTQVTVNISTVGGTSGSKIIRITNPDGQFTSFTVLLGPTVAKLDTFTATGFDDGRVLMEWQAGHEVDNLGYNVYREVAGQRTKITPQLLAGSAFVADNGATLSTSKTYAWADQPNAAARYWLEAIDLKGNSTWLGPTDIQSASGRTAKNLEKSTLLSRLGYTQAQQQVGLGSTPLRAAANPALPSAVTLAAQAEIANQAAIKLAVAQEGWYRLTQKDLVAAGLSAGIDPRKLQLFADGRQLPIYVSGETDGKFDATDSVEFYGLGLNSPFSKEHLYWLSLGAQTGLRIKTAKPTVGQPAALSFPYTVERTDRTMYFSALRNGDDENFFGATITNTPVDQTLNLSHIASATAGVATLTIALQGATHVPHQVRALLNGSPVGSLTFNGQARGVGNFNVPPSLLREGNNTVQLISSGSADVSMVDTVRLTYWRHYIADGNQLRFSANGGQEITVSGFTTNDIRVFDITNPNDVQEMKSIVSGSKTNASVRVTASGTGSRTLLAVTGSRVRTTTPKANIPSSWQQQTGADLIIVTNREMLASVEPLKARRQSQGLAVAVVDIEDVYDEFSFGNKTPYALRDFLASVSRSWSIKPRFLLLVGDASYDPNNYLGAGNLDVVPTKLIDTYYLEASSDDWFADFTGDGIAEIATGRLPASQATEVAQLVNKILRYEAAPASRAVLLAADSFDGFNYQAANHSLRQFLPSTVAVTEVARGKAEDADVRAQVLAAINSGASMINYQGHGNINRWRGNVLTAEDAATFTNQHLSLFVLMTCLNGSFTDPYLESLAERLLKGSDHGAAVVWASTAMCDPEQEVASNQEFYRALYEGATLGEAAKRAKAATSDIDVRLTWILFGDPSGTFRQ